MTEIATIENPTSLIQDAKTYSDFYAGIKAEIEAFEPDTSTTTGRHKIAALAYKVTRTKTAIDAAGKALNEEARAKINEVDKQRRKIREELDELAAQARKPLTIWEAAEEARKTEIDSKLRFISDYSNADEDDTEHLKKIKTLIERVEIDPEIFKGEFDSAMTAKAAAIEKVSETIKRAEKAEADQAELARLRAEEETRQKAEAERLEREAAEKRELERAEREAAEAQKRAEEAAKAAREDERRKAEEAIAKAEAEKQAVIDAAEATERERLAEEKRLADEQAERDADKAHRSEVMKAAKEAIMACGVEEDVAKTIVLSIIAGEIPNVSLRF